MSGYSLQPNPEQDQALEKYLQQIDMQVFIERGPESEYCPPTDRENADHYIVVVIVRGKQFVVPVFSTYLGAPLPNTRHALQAAMQGYREYATFNGRYETFAASNPIADSLSSWEIITRSHKFFTTNLTPEQLIALRHLL